jgi:hypothetical protein
MFTLSSIDVSMVNVIDTPLGGTLSYTIINKGITAAVKGPLTMLTGVNTIMLSEQIGDGPQFELQVKIVNEQYGQSSCSIRLDGQKNLRWNNRNYSISVRGNELVIKLIMVRLRQAPLSVINKNLKQQVNLHFNNNVLPFVLAEGLTEPAVSAGIWNDPEAQAQQYWGLNTVNRSLTVRTIKNELGIPVKTADADGWDRFFFEDTTVKLQDEGGFLWLEYGAVDSPLNNKPRFLIGLWVPKRSGDGPIDMVVNFGHSATAWNLPAANFPYRAGAYPYSINKADVFLPGHPQSYVNFGLSYFFETPNFSFYFAAQSVASKKPVVMVMPIIPLTGEPGKFGQPFIAQQGMYRLLLEVKQWLVQEGYSAGAGFSFAEWQGKTAKIGNIQMPATGENNFITKPAAGLKMGNIVVNAHSSGIVLLTVFMVTRKLPNTTDYPYDLFGAKEDEFDTLWKEIWDLDISHKDAMPRKDYIKLVVQWYKRGNRVLRLYRSQHTFSDDDTIDELRQLTPLREMKQKGNRMAKYWHNAKEDISLLFINNGYSDISLAIAGIVPELPAPGADWFRFHQVPMILGFGHASKMRLTS